MPYAMAPDAEVCWTCPELQHLSAAGASKAWECCTLTTNLSIILSMLLFQTHLLAQLLASLPVPLELGCPLLGLLC